LGAISGVISLLLVKRGSGSISFIARLFIPGLSAAHSPRQSERPATGDYPLG